MLTRTLLLGAGAMLALVVNGPARADTLEEALLQAYANNPGIELSRALTRSADERIAQARSAFGPQINAEVTYTYISQQVRGGGGGVTPFPGSEGFAAIGNVSLAQPLFTFGRLAAGIDLATATSERARQDLRNASQQLMLDVITAYVSLQRDLELYEVASSIFELLKEQRDVQAARLALRDATAPDVDQTESRMELAAGRVALARADVESSAAAYRALVGRYPDSLAPAPALPALPTLEQLYAAAETNSPQLLAAQFVEIGSRAQLAAARAERAPRVDGVLEAGRSPLGLVSNELWSEDLRAGVSLSMPIYAGGRISSLIRDSIQRNIAAQENVEQTRRQVRQALAVNWNALRSSEGAIPRFAAAVDVAQRAIDGTQRQQIAGLRTLRDVLEATNDLFNARSNQVQVAADRFIQHASVLRAAGLLTVDVYTTGLEYDPDSYAPPIADLAGLPLEPVLEPIDALLVANRGRDAGVQREQDPTYQQGTRLPDPLATTP